MNASLHQGRRASLKGEPLISQKTLAVKNHHAQLIILATQCIKQSKEPGFSELVRVFRASFKKYSF